MYWSRRSTWQEWTPGFSSAGMGSQSICDDLLSYLQHPLLVVHVVLLAVKCSQQLEILLHLRLLEEGVIVTCTSEVLNEGPIRGLNYIKQFFGYI
jgi:hypothetical protein